jgi:uncharacterized membrane protein YkoI
MSLFLKSTALIVLATISMADSVRADEEEAVPLEKLPTAVLEAVKKMFPQAEMVNASMEKEDDEVEYEVSLKEKGKQIDVMVEADGEIEELEKEIGLQDLPKAVTEPLEKMHAKSTWKSAEAVFEIEDGKEELEFYEVQLKSADGKEMEIKIKPSGKIVKDDHEDEEHEEKGEKNSEKKEEK